MRVGDNKPSKLPTALPPIPERSAVRHVSRAPAPQQGNPAISRPSAPFDAKGRSYDLWGTTDLFSGPRHDRIAHDGPPLGTEKGSPTYHQSQRNQLSARTHQAHIAHLTYPQDKGLRDAFRQAKVSEEKFTRTHSDDIAREVKAGHKDGYVPPQGFHPPSLGSASPSGPAAIPENHHPRPLHRDTLVGLDDMVNKAATAFVNKPGRKTEQAYKETLNARTVYEKRHKSEIAREMRSGAWNQPAVGWDHPDYRELKLTDSRTVQASNPVIGNRVYELGFTYRPPSGAGEA